MTSNPLFVPPAAEGLPLAALDSATEGADRLDAMALTPYGRNLLAHALVQLARDGWLRPEPGEGFEPVRDRETPEPESAPAVFPGPPSRAAALLEAADELGRMDYDTDSNDYGYDTYRDAWNGGVMDAADELRRLAAEAPQQEPDGARQQPDTEADAYDQRLTTPPSDEACAALRERLDSGTAARRTVQQPDAEARVVAYRSPGTRTLYCVTCARQEPGWQPVPATDVQDWTGCDFCGGRVLAVASQTLGETVARYLPEPEDPARIDRMRPEFTDHASIESIDAQLRRARSQERRWHLRAEWLVSLRQARLEQKARGEWPAAPVEPAAADGEETR